MFRARHWSLLGFFLACPFAVAAQDSPRDPGAIVLLAESDGHTADAELQRALLDPDPRVRATAARVIGAGNHVEIRGSVIGALLREKDPAAGAELVRAALHLSERGDLGLIEAQATRLGTLATLAHAEWLARAVPEVFVEKLPRLAAGENGPQMARLVDMAAAQHPTMQTAIVEVWMRVAPEEGWRHLLALAYGPPASLEPGATIIKAALSSSRASVREETIWFVVTALRDDRDVPQALIDAAAVAVSDSSPWEQFGRELMARWRNNARTPERSALIAADGAKRDAARALQGLRVLTKEEQEAVAALSGRRLSNPFQDWRARAAGMQTVDLPIAGVVGATLIAAGCNPTGELAEAAVLYWPDGRPRTIRVGAGRLPKTCLRAMSALARLSFAETGAPVSETAQLVVLPMHPSFLACSATVRTPAVDDRGVKPAGTIAAPKKIRDVKPAYPDRAQRERIQGVVILESVISAEGCVQSARVIRSIPYLDAAAVWAVTQWQFEPTLLDGGAVPVVMTVTVNFQLR